MDHARYHRRCMVASGAILLVLGACGEATELGASAAAPVLGDPPDYPIFTMVMPIRADDLEPGMVVRLSPEPGHRWHDLTVVRWDDGWQDYEPGEASEQGETDWGLPVYVGIDGEVVDCWRNSPYAEAFEDVADKQRAGGNFVTIRTDDDHFVYYAHMDTDSIPPQVCPRASEDGWLDMSEAVDCQLASRCMTTATYLPPDERPRVRAGQYLGRIGAHGQARGAHLHVHVGYIVDDEGGVINSFDDRPEHVVFEHAWFKPQLGSSNLTPWTSAFERAAQHLMLEHVEAGYTLLWPGAKAEATATASVRMHDFDGDGDDDLLCHDTGSGALQLDLARAGALEGTDWERDGWCHEATERLYAGDFDGDGRGDLLCRDLVQGSMSIDLADEAGELDGADLFAGPSSWCSTGTPQLLVGDFDGDGRDELLCHDSARGGMSRRAFGSSPTDAVTDTAIDHPWCYGHYERLLVGALDGEAGDDLLCHDTRAGTLRFDGSRGGAFHGTDATAGPWCMSGGQHLMLGDVTGSGMDALLCFDSDDGSIEIDWAAFEGTDWSGGGEGWCDGVDQRVKLGDVDGDGRDDLLCFDQALGTRMVDYARAPEDAAGIFGGSDWSSDPQRPWCERPEQALH